ncbi:MAG: GNAT family N-acetyltransferase [Methylorubrum populi]
MIEPCFHRNRSGPEDVRTHLTACAGAFTPPLGERVDLPDYAAKLAARAERFEAWAGPALVGLVAVYCNDPERSRAFVTNVSVAPERARAGLGRRLLRSAIVHARGLGFRQLALSVDRRAGACRLYEALGFAVEGREGDTLHLSLDLTPGPAEAKAAPPGESGRP